MASSLCVKDNLLIPFVKCVHFFCVRNSLQTLLLTVLSSHGFEFFHYLIFYLFINFTITSNFSWSIMMTFSFIDFFNTHLSRSSKNSLTSFLSSSKTFSYLPAYFISFLTTGYQSAVMFPFDCTFLKTVHQLFRWFLEIQGRFYLGLYAGVKRTSVTRFVPKRHGLLLNLPSLYVLLKGWEHVIGYELWLSKTYQFHPSILCAIPGVRAY